MMLAPSVEAGDDVRLEDGTAGAVVAIAPRATTAAPNDNANILAPKAAMMSGPLTNWTHRRDTRRVHIAISDA